MTDRTHVVLGGNGVAGSETIAALVRQGIPVASASRHPALKPGVPGIEADLLDPQSAHRALAGHEVAYCTVGLPYSASLWAAQWPVLLANVIDAAIAHGTHLVYLDNVYAYGEVEGPMTEQTPIRPVSAKGRVRSAALATIERARVERGLRCTIGRSADFYGPGASTSVVNGMLVEPFARGKPGTWLYDAHQPHSLTYTPDIGAALAILGTDPRAEGDSWHLPTAPARTGQEYAALLTGSDARVKVMSAGMVRFGGLFNRAARETVEMGYQFAKPYVFDSSRFETEFGLSPTPVEAGLRATLDAVRGSVRRDG